ncbi:MAG: vWA domain-containing protein [Bacilli bacterium]|jgi:Ca-activated chloride channel family protein
MKKIFFVFFFALLLFVFVGCGGHNYGSYNYPMVVDPDALGESYLDITENPFVSAQEQSTSAFALDTSTAGYANIRRMINQGTTVPKSAVKIEEMVNYFKYDYPAPAPGDGVGVSAEIIDCPWTPGNKLLTIGVKAEPLEIISPRKNNLVFLLDVSGSMAAPNKLPLMQDAFKLFLETLDDDDTISVVTYASGVSVRLNGAKGFEKKMIANIIEDLTAEGATAGSKGLQTAYAVAAQNFIEGGNNRIILGTDGDFNVGISNNKKLEEFITEKRKSGVYISVLGFGTGNLKDDKLEIITQNGNGKYSYIDSINEARKVLVEEIGGTLNVVAKDAKAQVTFNPRYVKEYRLLGYENKLLTDEEFEDEATDAGEIGAGHVATAVYELVLNDDEGVESSLGNNWLQIAVRFKSPEDDSPGEVVLPVNESHEKSAPSEDALFISGVIEFALLLRDSEYKGNASRQAIIARLSELNSVENDEYKKEFLELVEKYNK